MLFLLALYVVPLAIFWIIFLADKLLHGQACGAGGGDAPMIGVLLCIGSFIPFFNIFVAISIVTAKPYDTVNDEYLHIR